MRYVSLVLAALLECVATADSAEAADAGAGEQLAQQLCVICHKFDKDSGNGLGPNLFGVVGRKAASLSDFDYSAALKASKITWTTPNLAKWVAGPATLVPGTKMIFPGITSKSDIDNLLAYLETLK
jgi:cytochrome c